MRKKRDVDAFELTEIRGYIEEIQKKIIKKDRFLLKSSCHEQAVAHQIGCRLKKIFPDFDVDCEYDRNKTAIKELPDEGKSGRIRLDIIIHRRNLKENLLCIETKKWNRPRKEFDIAEKRLKKMIQKPGFFEYKFGLLMTFYKKEPFIKCKWFQNEME